MSNNASSSRKTLINVFCSLVLLGTNLIINFFLSPYIVEHIGVEANGFIQLANNFITYAQLIVTALNGMAARYITLEYTKQNYDKANLYYNSVFWGNLIIVAVLFTPSIIIISKLDNILNIPVNIVFDVKILFSIIFFNFFIGVALPNWECGTYVTNNLNRTYVPQAFCNILKCLIILVLFAFFLPKIWYVGAAVSVSTILMLVVNCINTHKLTPELHVQFGKKTICSFAAIKDLVGSGIWNSIASAGTILLTGLNLLICNKFIGAREMGILSLSQIFYQVIIQLAHSLRGVFSPEMTILYANNDKDTLLKVLNKDVRIASVLMTVPLGGIIAYGDIFYKLWVPSQDYKLLYFLTLLSLINLIFTAGIQILYNIFNIVDKVRDDALQTFFAGIVSIIINIFLLKFTNYGLYAIAGVTPIINLIRYLGVTVRGLARYLGYEQNEFYPHVFYTVLAISLVVLIGKIIHFIIPINTWMMFILAVFITALCGLFVNMLIFLSKEQRKLLFDKILGKISHGK